jgi:hypothetical protein
VTGKWLAKEENCSSGNSSGEGEVEVTSAIGDSNLGSGSGNPESDNCNPGRKEDRREEELSRMDVNMVFTIPAEFLRQWKMSQSWHWVLDVPCLRSQKTRVRT